MQIIVKCPDCGKGLLAHAGAGYQSEIITTERRTCSGCMKEVEVKIKIVASLVKADSKKE